MTSIRLAGRACGLVLSLAAVAVFVSPEPVQAG
jgi:hypothetical protein